MLSSVFYYLIWVYYPLKINNKTLYILFTFTPKSYWISTILRIIKKRTNTIQNNTFLAHQFSDTFGTAKPT